MLPSSPLTEPDVQISSFRFLTGELRSQRCSDGRSEVPVGGAALRDRYTDPMGIGSLAATATSARSSEPDRRTSLIDECCPICRSRHSGPALQSVFTALHRTRIAGCSQSSLQLLLNGCSPLPLWILEAKQAYGC